MLLGKQFVLLRKQYMLLGKQYRLLGDTFGSSQTAIDILLMMKKY